MAVQCHRMQHVFNNLEDSLNKLEIYFGTKNSLQKIRLDVQIDSDDKIIEIHDKFAFGKHNYIILRTKDKVRTEVKNGRDIYEAVDKLLNGTFESNKIK